MRASRTEIGGAREKVELVAEPTLGPLDRFELLGDPCPMFAGEDALGDGDGDLVGFERSIDGE